MINASLTMDNRSEYTENINEREIKQESTFEFMSADIDRIKNEHKSPITYSINIQTSTPKRPLTCYITATPRTANYFERSRENKSRSSIHLPVTYSTSIHVPCRPLPSPIIAQRSPIILPPLSSHHHHYHHHYYYHHHQRQPLPRSTAIKNKLPTRPTSIASTRPATTSTTTTTTTVVSPDSSPSPSKKSTNKQASHTHLRPPPLPSYSTLVWNWFHHAPTKPSSPRKNSQSDYSETYRHELPRKRSLLFKLLTSPSDKPSKSKAHRPCFTRKRLESSSSLPNKSNHYHE